MLVIRVIQIIVMQSLAGVTVSMGGEDRSATGAQQVTFQRGLATFSVTQSRLAMGEEFVILRENASVIREQRKAFILSLGSSMLVPIVLSVLKALVLPQNMK